MKAAPIFITSLLLLFLPVGCREAAHKAVEGRWVDQSPHKQGFVTVNGIKIEYLDWGGIGEPMIFLAGLGLTGHIYDQLAPQFTNNFHVIALTRRGFGASDKPEHGYEMPILMDDVAKVLDALEIGRAIVIGHSFGVQEAAALALAFPDRVSRVIYLDGAYDFSPSMIELNSQVYAFAPQPSQRDGASFSNLLNWYRRNKVGWNDACEADFRATRITTPDGISLEGSAPPGLFKVVMDALMQSPPDFSKVKAPALAIFADHQLDALLARQDKATKRTAEPLIKQLAELQRDQIRQFKASVKNAKVIELADTDHMCITQRQQEVAHEIRLFLIANSL